MGFQSLDFMKYTMNILDYEWVWVCLGGNIGEGIKVFNVKLGIHFLYFDNVIMLIVLKCLMLNSLPISHSLILASNDN